MKTLFKRIFLTLLTVVVLTAIGGTIAIWPMLSAPVTTVSITRPAAPVSPPEPAALAYAPLLAGIGERDITPPVGIPKMGYSAWAREADGFRTRLKARAFYLRQRGQRPVVIVQADLPAGSLLLRHKIAEAVARESDIPFSAISLHVTHTHSGPGQYFESDFYNTFGSNRPGFDPEVTDFLATRITDAILDAWRDRQPARVAVGETRLFGATRNRSIGAYVQNHTVSDKRTDEHAMLRAVDPVFTLVRIDQQDRDGIWKPRGAFSSFSIHGTGIPPFTHPWHGDVWAYLERDLERRIQQHYQTEWKPVHGPFQANHGDNNPNYRPGLRGDVESERIGLMIAAEAWQLFQRLDGQAREDLTIRHAMREIDLLEPGLQQAHAANATADSDNPPLCDRAIVGAATVGAAKGDEVFPISWLPPFAAGWPKRFFNDNCHAQKNWMLSWLQVWGLAPTRYPHRVNIAAMQVGELMLLAVPFEVTLESGRRIRSAIGQSLQAQGASIPQHLVVSSLSNGYFGYSTTPEEYSVQFYEGGHTIYGPGTTGFLADAGAALAASLWRGERIEDLPQRWDFALASARYFPVPQDVSGARELTSSPRYRATRLEKEAYWGFTYLDVNPSRLALHEPLLHVETRQGNGEWQTLQINGQPVDDQGTNLQIRHLEDHADGRSRYQIRWYNPPVASGDTQFRIAIAPRDQQPLFHSPAFGAP